MSETNDVKHTPGKWEVGYGNGVTGGTCPAVQGVTVEESIARSNGNLDAILHEVVTVADIMQGGSVCSSVVAIFPERGGEEKANAKLFAASKDLLQVVIDALPVLDAAVIDARHEAKMDTKWETVARAYKLQADAARAAIAKARGEA